MKGFRTLSVASIFTILGALQQAEIINIVPENYRGGFVAVLGLTMALLRAMTNTAPLAAE